MDPRDVAEEELKKDKNKSDDQIMADVYHELLNTNRPIPNEVDNKMLYLNSENIKHAFKRYSGFIYNQNRIANQMYKMSILISIIALFLAMTNLFPVHAIYKNISKPVVFVFIGVAFMLVSNFLWILRAMRNYRQNKISLIISIGIFTGLLLVEVGLYASLY